MTIETGSIDPGLFDRIPQLAAKAKEVFAQHIRQRVELYEQRLSQRNAPVPAFVGHGRTGKDTAAEYLCKHYAVEYSGSVSEFVNPLVAYSLGLDEQTSFQNRHKNRAFWKEYCNELRKDAPSFLVRMCLATGDMVCGIRGSGELRACLAEGVIDQAWWVERPGTPLDPTLEFFADDCDFVIRNAGSLDDYYRRLDKLAQLYCYVPRK